MKTLGNLSSAKRVLQKEWTTAGVPFYRAREIVQLNLYDNVNNELFISEKHYKELKENYNESIPIVYDIMISAVGTIGKTYIVKENDKFYYKDASVLKFRPNLNIIYPKFIKLFLESNYAISQMLKNSNGTTVDTITISSGNNYIIFLPPLEEQKRIAAKVRETTKMLEGI